MERTPLQILFGLVQAVLTGRNEPLENRRRAPRLKIRSQVLARVDKRQLEGELIDITYAGLRLRFQEPVKAPVMTVSSMPGSGLVGRQRLRCRVAWTRRRGRATEVGLEYTDTPERLATSWVQLALRRLNRDAGNNRRARRIPTNISVQLEDIQGRTLGMATCLDLGTGGARLAFERELPPQSLRMCMGGRRDQAPVFLGGRVVAVHSDEEGHFIHHVRFFPGENRDHRRLRSLLLNLLADIKKSRGSAEQEALP